MSDIQIMDGVIDFWIITGVNRNDLWKARTQSFDNRVHFFLIIFSNHQYDHHFSCEIISDDDIADKTGFISEILKCPVVIDANIFYKMSDCIRRVGLQITMFDIKDFIKGGYEMKSDPVFLFDIIRMRYFFIR